MADDKGMSRLFGEGLPGTGGDFIDTNDVEGHRVAPQVTPPPVRRDGAVPEDGSGDPLVRPLDEGGDEDVEGHVFTGGPTTQGEFAKRAPGDNPHGDR